MSVGKRILGCFLVALSQVLFLIGSAFVVLLLHLDFVTATILWDVIVCIVCVVWYVRSRPDGWIGKPLKYGWTSRSETVIAGIVAIVGLMVLATIAMSMAMLFFESRVSDQGMEIRNESVAGMGLMGYLALSVFVAPFAEEIFYRFFTYGVLRRCFGVWPAVVVSSLLFGAAHLTWGHLVTGFLFGVVLATIYEYTGAWWACIFGHFIYNISVIAMSMSAGLVALSHTIPGGVASCVVSVAVTLACCAAVARKEKIHGLYGVPGIPDRDEAGHPGRGH